MSSAGGGRQRDESRGKVFRIGHKWVTLEKYPTAKEMLFRVSVDGQTCRRRFVYLNLGLARWLHGCLHAAAVNAWDFPANSVKTVNGRSLSVQRNSNRHGICIKLMETNAKGSSFYILIPLEEPFTGWLDLIMAFRVMTTTPNQRIRSSEVAVNRSDARVVSGVTFAEVARNGLPHR
ncbi:unnamed protein product [Linum trigynum]|uniref:Uncharacterized protein n=1 Tax=Linum trigynum TaxID=586398 RepID=A0AAV2GJ89_9ROSI